MTGAGIGAFTTAINITDPLSTGGDAVAFGYSGTNSYANSFVITLANSSSGVEFSGPTAFTGNSRLAVTASGGILIDFGAIVSTSGAAISLVATGSNAPLTAKGFVLSNGGAITLQATAQ